MADTFNEFQTELEALRVRYGIETFLFIAESPFNEDVATIFGGSSAWIAGQAAFTADLMAKRWNADRT